MSSLTLFGLVLMYIFLILIFLHTKVVGKPAAKAVKKESSSEESSDDESSDDSDEEPSKTQAKVRKPGSKFDNC